MELQQDSTEAGAAGERQDTAPTPAEELLAAADKLDRLVAEATPGPWTGRVFDDAWHQYADVIGKQEVEQYSGSYTVTTALVAGGASEVAAPGWLFPGNASYIAAMNPFVGQALVDLLRRLATACGRDVRPPTWSLDSQRVDDRIPGLTVALDLARLLNGTGS